MDSDHQGTENDNNFAFVSAWENKGDVKDSELHKEQLIFDTIKMVQRSYK